MTKRESTTKRIAKGLSAAVNRAADDLGLKTEVKANGDVTVHIDLDAPASEAKATAKTRKRAKTKGERQPVDADHTEALRQAREAFGDNVAPDGLLVNAFAETMKVSRERIGELKTKAAKLGVNLDAPTQPSDGAGPHAPAAERKPKKPKARPAKRRTAAKSKRATKKARRSGPKGGRPRKPIDLALVRQLAMRQCTIPEIAAIISNTAGAPEGVSPDTLLRRLESEPGFAATIKSAREEGRGELRAMQWAAASKGNPAMLIWLGKQVLGQKDEVAVDARLDGAVSAKRKLEEMLDGLADRLGPKSDVAAASTNGAGAQA